MDDLEVLLTPVQDVRLYDMSNDGIRDLLISVLGDSVAAITAASDALIGAMNRLPEIVGASSAASLLRPENQITPRQELAAEMGVSSADLASTLRFASFVTPFTILMALPLAIGGRIFALYIYGARIGLSVVIGDQMLMGIVTKNAILLVDFVLEAMKNCISKSEAMLDASHKRARPIIMTMIALTAGMMPSALVIGEGSEFRAPMAVAVIGGLVLYTILSLLFVPSLSSITEGLKTRIWRGLVTMLSANQPKSA